MKIAARILAGLVALAMLGNGLAYMFVPDVQLSSTMITPDNIVGLANVRANIGGPMAAFGVLLALAAIRARKEPILPFMIFAAFAIIARITGLVVDGFDPFAVRLIVFIGVLLALTATSYTLFRKSESPA
ncbi:MAG: DUF4345 family protein [Chloroflexota bacterium]